MYIPPHFNEPRPQALKALIAEHPFGTLVTHSNGALDANHIPFLLKEQEDGSDRLCAHVARANPLWKEVRNGDEVLVIFQAGDAYISPNWYPSKHAHHKQVPTWNYMVVHAHGRIHVHDDEKYVRGVVARLTRTHEASEEKPWKMADSAPEFIDTMVKAIVGIEIEITSLVGKLKLSQNKEVQDIQNAGKTLNARGKNDIGDAMLAIADQKMK